MCDMFIMIMGLCFGIGTVWFIKFCNPGVPDSNTDNIRRVNVGCWKNCSCGVYAGTFNGKHWKTSDADVFDTINRYIGKTPIVDVDDILTGRVGISHNSTTKQMIDKYDKLLDDIGVGVENA